jgi:hypothetical protein
MTSTEASPDSAWAQCPRPRQAIDDSSEELDLDIDLDLDLADWVNGESEDVGHA